MSYPIFNASRFIFVFPWLFSPLKVAYSQEIPSEQNIKEHPIRVNQIRNLSTKVSDLDPFYPSGSPQAPQPFPIGQVVETPTLSQTESESVAKSPEPWRFKIQPTMAWNGGCQKLLD